MMLGLTIGVLGLVEPFWLYSSNKLYCLIQIHILDQMEHHGLFQLYFSFTGFIQGHYNSNTLSFIYYLIWYHNNHISIYSLFSIVCWYLLRDNLIKDWPFLWYFLSILNVFWAILFCFYYINLILILDIGFQQHILFQEYQCFSWEYVQEFCVCE